MAHWGWYWKIKLQYTPKQLCSVVGRLDSFELQKHLPPVQLKRFTITIGCSGMNVQQAVCVEQQQCYFGGHKTFIHCPLCSKRYRMLYVAEGVLACRKCLKLGYWVQRLSPSRRALYMGRKIEAAIALKGGSKYEKPKQMHRSTWVWLKDKLFDYDVKYEEALIKELSMYYPSNPLIQSREL